MICSDNFIIVINRFEIHIFKICKSLFIGTVNDNIDVVNVFPRLLIPMKVKSYHVLNL